MSSTLFRQSSLDRGYVRLNGIDASMEDIFRQRLDDAYYLRRMRDILQDGLQPRPLFPYQMTKLSDHLFIGNQKNAEDFEELMAKGITHVINCAPSRRRASCTESPYPLETGIVGFKVIPAEDKEEYDISKHFDETFAYLERVKQVKGRALIHCNMGVNRSGSIVAAYLMASEHRYLLEVIAFLKEKRKIVLTNKGFRRQLIRYARSKGLLDAIANHYYARLSGDFERPSLMDHKHAYSTPQLRRCVADQKPPRIRHRSGRSRTNDIDTQVSSFDSRDFIVRSLPRNLTRSRDSLENQWSNSLTSSCPMTRRSISYIVKDIDTTRDESEKRSHATNYQLLSSRKSIAVDHIVIPVSHIHAEKEHRHDDIPRLEMKPSPTGQFSSKYNLTISHPNDQLDTSGRLKESSVSALTYKTLPQHHTNKPVLVSPFAVKSESNDATTSSGPKNRYCKQIRQHFSELISLIRPNISRNITNQTSSPKSNQLSFPIPLQRTETRPIPVNREDTCNPFCGPSHYPENDLRKAALGLPTSYLSKQTKAASFQSFNSQNVDTRLRDHPNSSKASCDSRQFQLFSTKLNHMMRMRNQSEAEQSSQHSRGSLVLIGTRTTALQPQTTSVNCDSNHVSDAIKNCEPSTTPRRIRRYVRSKTDSEIL